jgi:hypothetical protein
MAILYRIENGHLRAEYGAEVMADPAVFSPEAIEELRREGILILGDPPSSGGTATKAQSPAPDPETPQNAEAPPPKP